MLTLLGLGTSVRVTCCISALISALIVAWHSSCLFSWVKQVGSNWVEDDNTFSVVPMMLYKNRFKDEVKSERKGRKKTKKRTLGLEKSAILQILFNSSTNV